MSVSVKPLDVKLHELSTVLIKPGMSNFLNCVGFNETIEFQRLCIINASMQT